MKKLFSISNKENGVGKVCFSWDQSGNLFAVCGQNDRVRIYSRRGVLTHQFSLPQQGKLLAVDWDYEGEVLAISQYKNSVIYLWHCSTKKIEKLETNTRDITFMKWSKVGPQLAIGATKGTLLIYNKRTLKLQSIKGKVSKAISNGCWNRSNNYLAICDDRTVVVNNEKGDTLEEKSVKNEPRMMKFVTIKKNNSKTAAKDTTLCVNVGGKCIWICETERKEKSPRPLELTFQAKYGKIVKFKNFGDGYLLVGFETGYVIVISTHIDEIGSEVCTGKFFRNSLLDLSYNPSTKKGVFVGDQSVQVINLSDLQRFGPKYVDKLSLDGEFGSLYKVIWTKDGNILSVGSKNGNVYSMVTSLPVIHAKYEHNVLYMTSLRQLCIKNIKNDSVMSKFEIEIEPSFLALGAKYVGVGMNNQVWYYKIGKDGKCFKLGEKQYVGTVENILIGEDYTAVLSAGKIALQLIEFDKKRVKRSERYFPEVDDEDDEITWFQVTKNFLVFSTKRGYIIFFSLDDWKIINHFKFDVGIDRIFCNALGTKIVFIDETHTCYLYNPVDDNVKKIQYFSGSANLILWDLEDPHCLISSDKQGFVTYVHQKNTVVGNMEVTAIMRDNKVVEKTQRPEGFIPIMLINGKVICQMPNGYLASITLESHSYIENKRGNQEKELMLKKYYQLLNLCKFEDAYSVCAQLDVAGLWEELAVRCLTHLEIEIAMRVYRRLGDASKVMTLEQISHIDELNLLLGYLAMLRKDFPEAEQRFLQSSLKIRALEMRRDLMHWDSALRLAKKFDPGQVPIISREYAQQLELQGDIENAFIFYEKALNSKFKQEKHLVVCEEGIARTQIKRGYHKIGFDIAFKSENKKLCKDCATLFEDLKLYTEASRLYIKADMHEKAAYLDLFTKNYKGVEVLLNKIQNPQILVQYAKAMEGEGQFKKSVDAYRKAGDFFNLVRVYLVMGQVSKAIQIVKNHESIEGAIIIADFYHRQKNYKREIEFLCLGKKTAQAFEIAKKHDEMGIYSAIAQNISRTELEKVAQYYQTKGDFAKAGDYYFKMKDYEKCLNAFFKCGDDRLNELIEIAGETQSSKITNDVLRFIMGEFDGKPKDLKYLFRLYLILKNYKQAISTALMISKNEREYGKYENAKRYLFEIHQELVDKKLHVSTVVSENLLKLQSYIIVKDLVKLKEFGKAAWLLLRVSNNISLFPKHTIPILISTVIYCNKANMKEKSFVIAKKLILNYRKQLEKKWVDKLVKMVRKYRKPKNPVKPMLTPCPFCDNMVDKYELKCNGCQNVIPFCIVTGQHMVKNDWSVCPSCNFNALYSMFSKLLQLNQSICPMCEKKVNSKLVTRISDPTPLLKKILAQNEFTMEEDEGEDDEDEDEGEDSEESEGEETEGETDSDEEGESDEDD